MLDETGTGLDFADLGPEEIRRRIAAAAPPRGAICATPYRWPDPAALPTRQWLLGHWLLRGEVTAIIGPGGTGKSTVALAMALSLASGRRLLDKALPRGPQVVWMYNLEDGMEELERQVAAACLFHGVGPDDCAGRLFLDTGLVQPLCTATETRDGYELAEGAFAQLTAAIRERNVGAVIVDPFVSSHAVSENDNGAINALAKRWKRLAQEAGCAVVLVHHVKKLGGREATAEDGRGAVALRDAARIVLALNGMSENEAERLNVATELRRALVRIDIGKANRAPADAATWIRLASQSLDNGEIGEPPDVVGVAAPWEKPDAFHGLSARHLYEVQQGLAGGEWRKNPLAQKWVGHLVAKVTGLSAEYDKGRIKSLISTWFKSGALEIETHWINGREVPCVVVGNEVHPDEIGPFAAPAAPLQERGE